LAQSENGSCELNSAQANSCPTLNLVRLIAGDGMSVCCIMGWTVC